MDNLGKGLIALTAGIVILSLQASFNGCISNYQQEQIIERLERIEAAQEETK